MHSIFCSGCRSFLCYLSPLNSLETNILQSSSFNFLCGISGDEKESPLLQLGKPDDVDVSIELKNWLFALEGAQEMAERWWFYNPNNAGREERCWHTSFQSFRVKAQSRPKDLLNGKGSSCGTQQYPVELVIVSTPQLEKLNLHKLIND